MTNEKFEAITEEQINYCKNLLAIKGLEYDGETADRLSTFYVAGMLEGLGPFNALAGMMAKHTTCLYEMMIGDPHSHSIAKWTEKITDHINYLLLLRALVEEELTDDV